MALDIVLPAESRPAWCSRSPQRLSEHNSWRRICSSGFAKID